VNLSNLAAYIRRRVKEADFNNTSPSLPLVVGERYMVDGTSRYAMDFATAPGAPVRRSSRS